MSAVVGLRHDTVTDSWIVSVFGCASRLQEYKTKYLVLHDAVLKTYANEKELLSRGRQLKQVRKFGTARQIFCYVAFFFVGDSQRLPTTRSNCSRRSRD